MKRRFVYGTVITITLVLAIVIVCDCIVSSYAKERIYSDVTSVPHRSVGIVLGTSPISTWNGRKNWYFTYRIHAAAELYNNGKVDKLIVSGGDYRNSEKNGYDEPVAMRDSLMQLGVPANKIILDYDGTRTLNSIAKAKSVYKTDSVILISQEYHNERALYQANYLGVDAIGYCAKTPGHKSSWLRNRGRECLARVKLFVDIMHGLEPDIKETMQPTAIGSALVRYSDLTTAYGDLICLVPDMSVLEIDLVCNSIPAADNDSIAMAFAGAFTGTMWDASHGNVAGDHVSAGHRYRGYKCKRNTGAFTWANANGAKFHYQSYSAALDKAAKEGGMGFTQEMMIHQSKEVQTTRPHSNFNQFRALCLNHEGHIAVIESHGKVSFGNFIKALLEVGVTEALYTDMGPGWNYCFYRQRQGLPTSFLHDVPQSRASNFVVFKLK